MMLDKALAVDDVTASSYKIRLSEGTTTFRYIVSAASLMEEAFTIDFETLGQDTTSSEVVPRVHRITANTLDSSAANLVILQAAAIVGDTGSFAQLASTIPWADYGPDEIAYAVRLALEAEAYPTARSLAAKGHALHPEDGELTKLDHVLAPPVSRVVPADRNEQAGRRATSQWLKEHHNAYQGQWVAVKDGKLLAAADSADEIRSKLGDMRNTGILLTYLW